MPDLLVGRSTHLVGDVAADVTNAATALARFDAKATALADTEALARLLLRAESVASSRIEGLEVDSRRLLRAEAAAALGNEPQDVTATEILANIQAMSWALDNIGIDGDITVDHLVEAHRRLLSDTRANAYAGRTRTEQNWIGGSTFNPCSASFVPPPPEHVAPLLEDLCVFSNGDDVPAIVQAAMAHAQFETIHPFADGNGRIGRVLIQLVLRRRGVAVRSIPPVSLILATWSDSYVAGLDATRYVGSATSDAAIAGTNRWVALFATACRRAVEDADAFEQQIAELQATWRRRLGRLRSDSSAARLIDALPGTPIVTVDSAAGLIGRTFQATNQAITRLVQADILHQTNLGRRNRAFEAPEVTRACTDLERRLASPAGDTRIAPPSRQVPRRT
ncbi:MAG TPA: Fic family protein [Acidimicrobiales bacterium]|nr:Fic family protein [Acidimicrobiales bacterium]